MDDTYLAVYKSIEETPDDEIYQAMKKLGELIEARIVGVRDINICAIVGLNEMTVNLTRARY